MQADASWCPPCCHVMQEQLAGFLAAAPSGLVVLRRVDQVCALQDDPSVHATCGWVGPPPACAALQSLSPRATLCSMARWLLHVHVWLVGYV